MTDPSETVVPISAIEHHEYCPRQCALILVDGLWADNPHTVAGGRAHRRVDSGVSRAERGRLVLRSIPLWSERLGLAGRADAVEVHPDGRVVPIEHKSGVRHGRAADLQLCAEALCLEEMLDTEIGHGYVWYGAWRRRWPVAIDEELRRATIAAIDDIRRILIADRLPSAPADERCRSCQLEPHCLPDALAEAGRLATYVQQEVLRRDT